MADSGTVTMLADNESTEAIAPMAITEWSSLTATGHRDVTILVYVSGYQAEWSDGDGWACAHKFVIGDHGLAERIGPASKVCVRAQGPAGEACRVVIS